MRRGRGQARPEQIAELTRGLTLPLPALQEIHLKIIAEKLILAWNDLLERHEPTLRTGNEPDINALVVTRLNALRDKDQEWESLVSGVTRGAETVNFDGSRFELRPDLSLSLTLTNARRNFPLVVECKLLHTDAGKDVKRYCADGLARFLHGDYAWAVREAFMFGYVRDESTIATHLAPFLGRNASTYFADSLPEVVSTDEPRLARSLHNRTFDYLHEPPTKPGPIAIWHLWLSV